MVDISEDCRCHVGMKVRVDKLEDDVVCSQEEHLRLWTKIGEKLSAKIFWIFLGILTTVLSGLFVTQIIVCQDVAVIKNEVSHINQVKESERVLLGAIDKLTKDKEEAR
jgi:hypothetical protein